jgi:hypothetical protein
MNRGRVLAGVLLALAAFALQQSATRAWGRGVAADGSALVVTPVGLSRRAPGDARAADCRWWPRYGDPALCAAAPGGEGAHDRLRLAYPALLVALWLSVATLFLVVLRLPRPRWVRVSLSLLVAVLVGAGAVLLVSGATTGLAALRDAAVHFTAPGVWLAAAAAIAAAGAAVLEARAADSRTAGVSRARAAERRA